MAGRYPRHVTVYTDGSCRNNGQYGRNSAGIGGYFEDNMSLNFSERVKGDQTPSVAEIQAATRAIQIAKNHGYTDVTLITDSKVVAEAGNGLLNQWKATGYQSVPCEFSSDGSMVKNREEFQKLDSAMQGIKVNIKHVAGHSGIYGNQQAHRLAQEGASK